MEAHRSLLAAAAIGVVACSALADGFLEHCGGPGGLCVQVGGKNARGRTRGDRGL